MIVLKVNKCFRDWNKSSRQQHPISKLYVAQMVSDYCLPLVHHFPSSHSSRNSTYSNTGVRVPLLCRQNFYSENKPSEPSG